MQPPSNQTPDNPPKNTLPAPVQFIDEGTARILSAAAHGAIAFGLFGLGFLVSLGIAGIIWLYGKRSPEVRFHSEQAGCYQCSVLVINALAVIVLGGGGGYAIYNFIVNREFSGLSWGLGVGLILFVLWFFASIAYGVYAAVRVLLGKPFKYPIIGNRFREP